MTSNKYINRGVQKAFMTATPGCTEHHTKLAAILSEARRKHKSLTACWLNQCIWECPSCSHPVLSPTLPRSSPVPEYPQVFLLRSRWESHHTRLGYTNHPPGDRGLPGRPSVCRDIQYSHQHSHRHPLDPD